MVWKEPGNGHDPWGKRKPDRGQFAELTEWLKKLQRQWNGGEPSPKGPGNNNAAINMLIAGSVIILALVWVASGIYIVQTGDKAVVFRFGAYQRTMTPGPHWHVPFPVERVEFIKVDRIRVTNETGTMITADENIIEVEWAIQYRVLDVADYLFNLQQPDATLKDVGSAAIREVIGQAKMDFVLGEGRSEVATMTQEILQTVLDQYNSGLMVTAVNLQDAQPPSEVQNAFEDAVMAREDEVRLRNEATAYANDVIPKARGHAARLMEKAQGYRQQVISGAEGETARFMAIYQAYEASPEVLKKRLFLDMIESVLSSGSKTMLDLGSSGNTHILAPAQGGKGQNNNAWVLMPEVHQQGDVGSQIPLPEEQ